MSHKSAKRQRRQEREARAARVAEGVRRFCLGAIEAAQAAFRERAREQYERFPNAARPCHTCAINPGTNDWEGMDSTALRFLNALDRAAPFYCHDGAPFDEEGWHVDPATAPLCAGYAVLAADEALLARAVRAGLTAFTDGSEVRTPDDDEVREVLDQVEAILFGCGREER